MTDFIRAMLNLILLEIRPVRRYQLTVRGGLIPTDRVLIAYCISEIYTISQLNLFGSIYGTIERMSMSTNEL